MAPECFGHIEIDYDSGIDFEADCYNVPAADVWSLGIVLLNLISGRCPWDKASVSDLIFQQYVTTDPDILREKLNMSEKLDDFLREKVFNMVPEKRCNLNEFNAFVSSQKCFRKDDFSTSVSDFKIVGIDSEPSVYYSNTTFDQ
jgi:serine/threonine protein kinase